MQLSKSSPVYKGRNRHPIAIDLFSGCGGLTLGLKQAGFKVIGAVEIDPLAVETYRKNHKGTKIWHLDIRELDGFAIQKHFRLRKGQLDLLAGCPPCQGFSSIRTLNGSRKIEDARNDLVFEYLRLVRQLLPKAIMMENVPGLAKDPRMVHILDELKRLGYHITPNSLQVLGVGKYGVPQRRRRMLLLSSRFGAIEFARPDEESPSVRDWIEFLPPAGQSGDPLHDFPEHRNERVMAFIKRVPKDGGSRLDVGKENQLPCHHESMGFKDVYGRMAWDKLGPTITGGCTNPSKGRFIHPEQDRAITLREAALLQTFPGDYHFSLRRGKLAAAVLVGNALPPEFVRRHAEPVVNFLSTIETRDRSGDDDG